MGELNIFSVGMNISAIKRSLEHGRKCEPSGVPCERVQIQIENDKSLVNVPKKLAHRIGLQNKTRGRIWWHENIPQEFNGCMWFQ